MEPLTSQSHEQPSAEPEGYGPKRSTTIEGIVNTLEWLLVALILALVFRAFAVEAFQIPTGSMAETLCGSHYSLRCTQCGFTYAVDGDSSLLNRPQCPSCGYNQEFAAVGQAQNGDRIFVLKCLYPFMMPERWDVVVFKNPPDPQQNYIKRLVGLPGETIQIIDGDIYINGQIRRKPPRVQRELWMCIYNNDYQPVASEEADGVLEKKDALNHSWCQPYENEPNSRWDLAAAGPTVFGLDQPLGQTHTIFYNTSVGQNFHAAYAYNNDRMRQYEPTCSDLMMQFYVQPARTDGCVGVSLKKRGVHYIAKVNFGKAMILEKLQDGQTLELARMPITPTPAGALTYFEFANVDRRLVFRFGDHRLSFDLSARGEPTEKESEQPMVKILGEGRLQLRHIVLSRDTYYTSDVLRATAKKPVTLDRDEFFVCGDNSPNSSDSRLWLTQGKDIMGRLVYPEGIVPKDYMMGKAFFVYWADPFSPSDRAMPIIPNIDRLKIIVGGSEEVY